AGVGVDLKVVREVYVPTARETLDPERPQRALREAPVDDPIRGPEFHQRKIAVDLPGRRLAENLTEVSDRVGLRAHRIEEERQPALAGLEPPGAADQGHPRSRPQSVPARAVLRHGPGRAPSRNRRFRESRGEGPVRTARRQPPDVSRRRRSTRSRPRASPPAPAPRGPWQVSPSQTTSSGAGLPALARDDRPLLGVHLVADARPLAQVAHARGAALGEVPLVGLRRKVVIGLPVADLDAEELLDEVDVVHADGVVVGQERAHLDADVAADALLEAVLDGLL